MLPLTWKLLRPSEVKGQQVNDRVCLGGVFPCRPKFLVKACLDLASGKIVMHFSCDAQATPPTWSFLVELAVFYALFMA